jgi:hypothetical protein
MQEEDRKLELEVFDWIKATSRRMATEQRCQHASRNFGEFSIVLLLERNKTHGNLELAAYCVDTTQLQAQLSGTVPMLFEEGW